MKKLIENIDKKQKKLLEKLREKPNNIEAFGTGMFDVYGIKLIKYFDEFVIKGKFAKEITLRALLYKQGLEYIISFGAPCEYKLQDLASGYKFEGDYCIHWGRELYIPKDIINKIIKESINIVYGLEISEKPE